jgi:hypothetical protein
MGGAIPTFPNKPSWRGAQLKHRDKFNVTFIGYVASISATVITIALLHERSVCLFET